MTVYHIHAPERAGDMYSICKGDPNDPTREFSSKAHACKFEQVAYTKWGAKRWIKKELKKQQTKGSKKPFWELPIVGAYTYDPRK